VTGEAGRARTRLVTAILASAALIAAAPFFGIVRDALLAALPRAFAPLLLGAFVLALAAAVAFAARRIRTRRLLRYGALAAALALAGALVVGFGSGELEVDAVERIHVVAYGLLAFLYARAFAHRGDLSTYLLALLSASLVGVIDEWLQWLVPTRVGEVRDTLLNAGATLPGLLVFGAVQPAPELGRPSPAARRSCLRLLALLVAVTGGFYDGAHLGHRIESPGIGSFVSYHSPEALRAAVAERAERWRTRPPETLSPIAREDYFLTEATWRVKARNDALAAGDLTTAWLENRLLEEHYAPVLDLRGLRSGHLHRWPDWTREDVERRRPRPDPAPYASPVLAERIRTWPSRGLYWTVVTLTVLLLLAVASRLRRAGAPRSSQ
jgi:hypothetical protein